MRRLYGDACRALQDRFDTRLMADRIEEGALVTEISPEAGAFIETRDMFFLATVDQSGRPTVSYKGGAPGFVRVVDETTLAFPSYDGNGMYFSMGNIAENHEVGMLFIDFERPHRVRVQGAAEVCADDPLIGTWHGAELVVRVRVHELWQNCPRYVPHEAAEPPVAGWKRIDDMQDVLRPHGRAQVERVGRISAEDWMAQVERGDEQA